MQQQNETIQQAIQRAVEAYGSNVAVAKAARVCKSSNTEWLKGRTKPSIEALTRLDDHAKRHKKGRFNPREIRPELF